MCFDVAQCHFSVSYFTNFCLQVDMALDFSVVNVRWEATGGERDKQIEQHLPQCESALR